MGAVFPLIFVIIFIILSGRGCNNFFNNKVVLAPGHTTISRARGLSGHTEYTRYEDGSKDVKTYTGWGHRLFDSQLDQDLDGDGKVDRIRKNSGEIKGNSLAVLLVRKYDYLRHKKTFQEADSRLQKLMEKYPQTAAR